MPARPRKNERIPNSEDLEKSGGFYLFYAVAEGKAYSAALKSVAGEDDADELRSGQDQEAMQALPGE